MKFRHLLFSAAALLGLMACDEDTSTLGGSIIPEDEKVVITSENLEAATKTVFCPDSLLAKTAECYLGRYTDPYDSTVFTAGYLTQLNCVESFDLPDSVYGIGNFVFPPSTHKKWKGVDPYYANLRIYYTEFFGDSLNAMKIEIFELDRMIDANRKYYANTDPSEFVDLTKKPIATAMVSPIDLAVSDETRNDEDYYPNITIRLPQEFAKNILEKYYQPGGREYFTSAKAFMENVCKGFYIRCTQGDGSIFYVDRSVLELNHKSIMYVDGEPRDTSLMSDFSGNNEVMQINTIKWEGQERLADQNDCSWIQSPYGLLTEVTIPVDEIEKEEGALNSVQMVFCAIPTPTQRFKISTPGIIGMFRTCDVRSFFESSEKADASKVFLASYTQKTATYKFSNIGPLVNKMIEERNNWLKENGYTNDSTGKAAYALANPDWNKTYLVPVAQRTDGNSSVVGYYLDMTPHRAKLAGGINGDKVKIRVVRTSL